MPDSQKLGRLRLGLSVLVSDFVTYCSNELLQSGGETLGVVSKEIMGSECVSDKSNYGNLWREENSKNRNTSRLADGSKPRGKE